MKDLNYLNSKFVYKPDGSSDRWTLMKLDNTGKLRGDCEDYSLWVAYHTLAKESWAKLYWMVVTRKIKFHYVRVRSNWEPHMVLEYDGKFIDNGNRRWVDKTLIEKQMKFKHRAILPVIWFKQLKNFF